MRWSTYAMRANSRYRQNALASSIWRGVSHRTWDRQGLATITATHLARETATFSRFRLYRNSIPLGASSGVEVAIEYKTTGASCPWNLSTVPTLDPAGSLSKSAETCAL